MRVDFVPVKALTRRLVDVTDPRSLSGRARHRRWQIFNERFPDIDQMNVLDLGGTAVSWQLSGLRPARLVLLNLADAGGCEGTETVIGDACDLPEEISDSRFDLVYSNSVIEHVGGHWRRQRFAETVRDMAAHHWIQTPYRYFPVEPHWAAPGFQFVPLALRGRLIVAWPIGSLAMVKDWPTAVMRAQGTELLSKTEMRGYFPDSDLLVEHIFGLPKSLIAVR
jgi:hypothetical protein